MMMGSKARDRLLALMLALVLIYCNGLVISPGMKWARAALAEEVQVSAEQSPAANDGQAKDESEASEGADTADDVLPIDVSEDNTSQTDNSGEEKVSAEEDITTVETENNAEQNMLLQGDTERQEIEETAAGEEAAEAGEDQYFTESGNTDGFNSIGTTDTDTDSEIADASSDDNTHISGLSTEGDNNNEENDKLDEKDDEQGVDLQPEQSDNLDAESETEIEQLPFDRGYAYIKNGTKVFADKAGSIVLGHFDYRSIVFVLHRFDYYDVVLLEVVFDIGTDESQVINGYVYADTVEAMNETAVEQLLEQLGTDAAKYEGIVLEKASFIMETTQSAGECEAIGDQDTAQEENNTIDDSAADESSLITPVDADLNNAEEPEGTQESDTGEETNAEISEVEEDEDKQAENNTETEMEISDTA